MAKAVTSLQTDVTRRFSRHCLLGFRITRLLDPITCVAMVTSLLRQQNTVWHSLLLRKPLFSSSQKDEKLWEVAHPAPESCKCGTWLRNNRASKAWLVLLKYLRPKVICWVYLHSAAAIPALCSYLQAQESTLTRVPNNTRGRVCYFTFGVPQQTLIMSTELSNLRSPITSEPFSGSGWNFGKMPDSICRVRIKRLQASRV